MRRLLPVALLLAVLVGLAAPAARAGLDPSDLLVLYNRDDPDALVLAEHYARARHLPPARLLGLAVPRQAELTLDEFRATIEEPLRDHLFREDLDDRVRVLVLVRGIPVRVRLAAGHVATAALLAVMDRPLAGRPQRGIPGAPNDVIPPARRANPYRDGPFPADARPGGRPLRLVTALDGWTVEDVTALIDRGIAADAPPTDPLFVFQDAAGNAAGRNASYAEGVEALRALGMKVETAPAGKEAVRERRDLMGWMSGGAYSKLDDAGVTSNAFAPGALVDMLESFGAVPGNFVEGAKRSQYPVPMMIRAGATGVHGAVAEPYAHTFPDVRLFDRYVAGLTLAEAFHASLPYLHWQNLVIGDPLVAPFAPRPQVTLDGLPASITEDEPVALEVGTTAPAGAPDVARLGLFIDGIEIATAEGGTATFDLNPATWPDGDHQVLVVARLDDTADTRGWTGARFHLALDRARVAAWSPRSGAFAASPTVIPESTWTGRARSTPRLVLRDGAGDRVAGRSHVDRDAQRVWFEPSRPLEPGGTYHMETVGLSSESDTAMFTVGAGELEFEGPDSVVAGEVAAFVVRLPADALPTAFAGEVLEVRASSPPILLARRRLQPDAPPDIDLPLRFPVAGTVEVRVRARGSGATAVRTIDVQPGAPARIFANAPRRAPIGEPFAADVEIRDALGNRVTEFDGRVRITIPADPGAEFPAEPVPVAAGHVRIPGLVLTTPGPQRILTDVEGLGQGGAVVLAEATTIRTWRLAGPWPVEADTRPENAGPAARTLRALEGLTPPDLDGRPWRTPRVPKPQVDAGRTKGILIAVTRIETPAAADVEFHFGHGGAVRAWLGGEPLYTGEAGKPEVVRAKVAARLPGGPVTLVLRLAIRGAGQDAFAVAVRTPGGDPVEGLRVR